MASPINSNEYSRSIIDIWSAANGRESFRIGPLQHKLVPDLGCRIVNRTNQTFRAVIKCAPSQPAWMVIESRVNVEMIDIQDLIDHPNRQTLDILPTRVPSEEEMVAFSKEVGVPVETLIDLSQYAFHTTFADQPQNKVELLILSCLGGNGHEAARRAIEEQIGHAYNSHVIYPMKSLKKGCSPDFENVYNWLVRRGWNGFINKAAKLVPPLLADAKGAEDRVTRLVDETIRKVQPALIISVAPIFNRFAIQVSARHRLPYCLVTTDFDLSNWVLGLEKIDRFAGRKFCCTIGPDIAETRALLEARGVQRDQVQAVGFPVRAEFYEAKPPREVLCEELQLPRDKQIILIMSGGSGGMYAYNIAKFLVRQPLNAHFVVIAGKNLDLRERVSKLPLESSNSLTAVGFTNRVSDYMRVARLMPTKPGPGCIEEASILYRKFRNPFVLLETKECLFWEKRGIRLVEDAGFGAGFTDEKDLLAKVREHFHGENPEVDLGRIPENRFRDRIVEIVNGLTE